VGSAGFAARGACAIGAASRFSGMIHTATATAATAIGTSQPTVDGCHHRRRDSGGVVLAIAASSA
jgi:hypothetical protein